MQGEMEWLFRPRFAFAHQWRIGQTDQNAFRAEQTGHCLTPWLFLCCYQERVAFCFQLFRGLGNIFYVKFEPGGRSWQIKVAVSVSSK